MDSLCFQTKAIVQKVPEDLSELEHLLLSLRSPEAAKRTAIGRKERQIGQNLDLIVSNCQRLHVLSNNEPPSKRSQMQLTIDHINSECKYLRANLQSLQRKRAVRERELEHRSSLFEAPSNASEIGETVLQMDNEVNEFSRLQTVGRRIDEMLLGGAASLEALRHQGGILKNSQRRLFDMVNTLGLSNAVMRLIERRSHQDKVVFYLLAVSSLVLMYLIWRFLRG